MTQEEKRKYLIRELLSEQPQDKNIEIPGDTKEQKRLLRSLMNIREPRAIGEEFLKVQDEYLSAEVEEKGITDSDALLAFPINHPLGWGYYHVKGGCHCKCGQQCSKGMFCTLPLLRG